MKKIKEGVNHKGRQLKEMLLLERGATLHNFYFHFVPVYIFLVFYLFFDIFLTATFFSKNS